MRRIRLSLARWDDVLAGSWAPQVYVFCRETVGSAATLHVRMFSPALGMLEDNGTGAAAVAFAGYAAARETGRTTLAWTIEQGVELGRPSALHLTVEVRDGVAQRIRLGGDVVIVGEGEIAVPPA
jgi:trans-2,3-dihydro-3-hydroxyanthranilate isomerase